MKKLVALITIFSCFTSCNSELKKTNKSIHNKTLIEKIADNVGKIISEDVYKIKKGKKDEKVFIVPLVLGYHVVLEAKFLIEQHLKQTGKEQYISPRDETYSARKLLKFGWNFFSQPSEITLSIVSAAGPVQPQITQAILGRATHVGEDQTPAFVWQNGTFTAPVDLAPGNWNLRVELQAEDGTLFRRRIPLTIPE